MLEGLIRPEFAAAEADIPLDQRFEIGNDLDPLIQMQQLDLHTYLVDDNLRKVDAMSMACSIEVRVPLLDHRLVEFSFSLPLEYRCTASRGKIVLRESLRRHLPSRILKRNKIGFKVPLRIWTKHGRMKYIFDMLQQREQPVWRIVQRETALLWLNQRQQGRYPEMRKIWNLIVLNTWLQQSPVH